MVPPNISNGGRRAVFLAEFKCIDCGTHVTTYRIVNYRTIPPSMDERDLCQTCKDKRGRCMTEQDRKDARMPEEPTAEMRDVIAAEVRRFIREHSPCVGLDIYRALYAHLSKPKTKEVEVWRVEWADGDNQPRVSQFPCKGGADDWASRLPSEACGRVTGPHKQTVPA